MLAARPLSAKPPAAFPPRARVRAARRFIARRAGIGSFALIDSRGRVYGYAPRRTYVSASVTKAMLLVAYLRALGGRRPSAAERGLLGPMIRRSDNDRADTVYARVGDAGLLRVARRARMRHFAVGRVLGLRADHGDSTRRASSCASTGSCRARNRAYARRLLASIVRHAALGLLALRRSAPAYGTFFKGGWRGTALGRLVHEAALFERGGTRFAMAVLTDGNPSHEYGTATLRGVAARIFATGRRSPRAGRLRPSRRCGGPASRTCRPAAPGIRVDLAYGGSRNLTGRRLPGYCRPWAYLLRPAARDLARVQRDLRRRGHGLLVRDAYRPARASRALVRWARRSGRPELVGTYIARRSRHNTGGAVDLTLVRAPRRAAAPDGHRLRPPRPARAHLAAQRPRACATG